MKRIKKFIIGAAAVAILGTGYCANTTDYKRIPEVLRIFDSVVLEQQGYENTLIRELETTKDENIANRLIDTGYSARKRINSDRNPADYFADNPYDLRINIEHSPEGDEVYLVDTKTGEEHPIYSGNHVGGVEHRFAGLYNDGKRAIEKSSDKLVETALQGVMWLIIKGGAGF